MNLRFLLSASALPVIALTCCLTASAQAPAGAPAGSTGQCKDGTYSNAASKSGACSGHKGVQTWYAAPAAKPVPAAKAVAAAAPAPAAKPTPAPAVIPPQPAPAAPAAVKSPRAIPPPPANAAPGGGPGMVWVNTSTKVYHCPGDRYYGKTKEGKYMTESAAQAMGARADDKKSCSK